MSTAPLRAIREKCLGGGLLPPRAGLFLPRLFASARFPEYALESEAAADSLQERGLLEGVWIGEERESASEMQREGFFFWFWQFSPAWRPSEAGRILPGNFLYCSE